MVGWVGVQMTVEIHAGREAWLAARLEGYGMGASATPKILGMSPYGGPWDVWCAHHAPELLEPPGEHVKDGAALEGAVIDIYERHHRLDLTPHDFTIYTHPKVPWLRFSPDATEGPHEAPTVHHEVKVVMNPDVAAMLPQSGSMPLDRFPVGHWPYQGLHQLGACPSLTAVVFVAFLPWFEIRTYRMERVWVRDAIVHSMRKVRDWRQKHLVNGERPPIDSSASCGRWHDWANPAPEDWDARANKRPMRLATEKETELAYAYAEARREAGRMTARHKAIRNELLTTVGDAYRLDLPCGGSVKFTAHQHRQIKVEDLRED